MLLLLEIVFVKGSDFFDSMLGLNVLKFDNGGYWLLELIFNGV